MLDQGGGGKKTKKLFFIFFFNIKGATSIIGGGDTVNLVKSIKGSDEKISHVSTGGGASLELLEGKMIYLFI